MHVLSPIQTGLLGYSWTTTHLLLLVINHQTTEILRANLICVGLASDPVRDSDAVRPCTWSPDPCVKSVALIESGTQAPRACAHPPSSLHNAQAHASARFTQPLSSLKAAAPKPHIVHSTLADTHDTTRNLSLSPSLNILDTDGFA